MLESLIEMKMRCNLYWSTVRAVRAHARRYTAMCAVRAHVCIRTAEACAGWWAGGGCGLLEKIPCNFLAASPALYTKGVVYWLWGKRIFEKWLFFHLCALNYVG